MTNIPDLAHMLEAILANQRTIMANQNDITERLERTELKVTKEIILNAMPAREINHLIDQQQHQAAQKEKTIYGYLGDIREAFKALSIQIIAERADELIIDIDGKQICTFENIGDLTWSNISADLALQAADDYEAQQENMQS